METANFSIKKLQKGILNKEFSAFEVTRAYLDAIKKKDDSIGAYLDVFHDGALSQARDVDVKIAKGDPLGGVFGAPLAIKDNIVIKDTRATGGSKILENYRASYDASVIEKLRAEDAIFLGKTNLDEFAMGSSTENSGYQLTRNPHDLTRVPGGSSGGSVAAVSAGEAVGALGSDTGGSIRQPAAFCGTVGLKPTYGAVSRYGLMALGSSLDQIGPITNTVSDAAQLLKSMGGKDAADATSVDTSYGKDLLSPDLSKIKNLKVGIPKEYFTSDMSDEVARAVDAARASLKSLGVKFKEITLPHTQYAVACYYIIMPAEASSNLARYDGIRYSRVEESGKPAKNLSDFYKRQRTKGFGPEPKRRIVLGTFVLSSGYYDAYYTKAQKVRALIKKDFDEAFKKVDVIFAPTTPTTAFKIGEKVSDPLSMYLSDIYTVPANLAGLPAVSIPVRGRDKAELPVGFQLIGKHFHEKDILGIGQFYDRIFDIE